MDTNHDFKVRDLRKKEQFIIDDAYLNGYGRIFGPIGTAVYLSLCRRADKKQSCWPSEIRIAADHGMTDRTVRKYIKIFAEANLVRIEHERTQSGKWPHNIYYLLDKSEWKKPEETNDQNQRKQVPLKDAHLKEAHKKDGNPIKKSFEEKRAIPLDSFEPSNGKEFLCLEIARWLGEKNMNFVLYGLRRYGFSTVEKAYVATKETDARTPLQNRRSYFNAVIRKTVDARANSFPDNQ